MSPRKRRGSAARPNAHMTIAARAFTPTANRRLNELIGFLMLVLAVLLVLALVSYSPLDPSLNTASTPPASRPAHNWIGVVGALVSDLGLQLFGVAVFLIPVFLLLYSLRWFRSRPITAPYAKTLGAVALVTFLSGFIGLLPLTIRWKGVIPSEGLLGRIVADALIHYLNLAGAYLVCLAVIAVALYLSTAFSFGALQIWAQTRFAFVYAALDRFGDWRIERARKKAAKDLEKKRAGAANAKPVVTAQLIPKRVAALDVDAPAASTPQAGTVPPVPQPVRAGNGVKSGIERTFGGDSIPDQLDGEDQTPPEGIPAGDIAVTSRADSTQHGKTTMPRLAGSYKLPSTALLHRPDEHSAINELELKNLAQVLAEKCGEFDVRGQVVQINPGPWSRRSSSNPKPASSTAASPTCATISASHSAPRAF